MSSSTCVLRSAHDAWLSPAPCSVAAGVHGACHLSLHVLRPGAAAVLSRTWLVSSILLQGSSVSRRLKTCVAENFIGCNSAGNAATAPPWADAALPVTFTFFIPNLFLRRCNHTVLAGHGLVSVLPGGPLLTSSYRCAASWHDTLPSIRTRFLATPSAHGPGAFGLNTCHTRRLRWQLALRQQNSHKRFPSGSRWKACSYHRPSDRGILFF